jgi:MoaA/NifB/PqqE/SkfB family radical SAM enzyme
MEFDIKSKLGLMSKVLVKQGNPIYLIYFVTSRCNAKCDFCFYYTELNKKVPEELKLEEIEEITKKYGKLYQVILTGGEPFLRSDLPEIAELFYKNCGVEQLAVPTNAAFPEIIEKKVEIMLQKLKNIPLNINLSLNGIGEAHDKILQVKNGFKKFVDTYNRLVKLNERYPRLGLSITATLSSLNEKNFLELYDYCLKNFPKAVFQPNLVRGEPKISTDVDVNVYKEVLRRMNIDKQHRKNTLFAKLSAAKNSARSDLIVETVEKGKFITPCYAGKLQGVLYGNGDVFACEILDKKIGNIRDFNFDFGALWKSEANKAVVKFIKDTDCFCTHECFYTTNMLFNPKHYGKIGAKLISFSSK